MRLHEDGVRERNADATRASLLQAAKLRFTVHGYDRTTVREIAADAGANVSLINRYFGSKDGLLAAVLGDTAQTLEDIDASAETTTRDEIVDKLLESLRHDAWPEYGNEHPLLLLIRDVGADERTIELRRRTLKSVVLRLTASLEGVPADDPDEAQLRATLVLALVTGVVALQSAMPGPPFDDASPDRLRAALSDATRAILGPPART